MTAPDFHRLAEAVRLLEAHRVKVRRLMDKASRLAGFDVVVVVGEQAVLERLEHELDDCQQLLTDMTAEAEGLDRLERMVNQPAWSVLGDVQEQLNEKERIAEEARAEVESKLAEWSGIAGRVEETSRQIQAKRLRLAEPRKLASSRSQLTALIRQANASFKENRLLDVWRALNQLENAPSANGAVPLADVPKRLEALLKRASPGPLQLTD